MSTSTFLKAGLASFTFLSAAAFGYGNFVQSATAEASQPQVAAALTQAQPSQTQAVATGNFTGLSKHVTKGQVKLVQTADGYALEFSDTFFLDGAPDPIVGFGQDGEYIKASKVGALTSKRGSQSYVLPANFTPSHFNQVYIWCEKFSVPLGVASLTAA